MGWVDSRDRHRIAKHCFTTKGGWQLFLSHSTHVRVTRHPRVPRALHCVSTLWLSCSPPTVLVQSDTGLCFGRCGVASSLFLQLHARRWPPDEPCCFSPRQASCCSRQLFSSSHKAKRISRTIDDSRGYIQHDTFTEPDTFPHNFTYYSF